ncbi:trafficking protein particle complex subunit 10 [Galendromus occidentalis]|uniref:Trafficking protein particle complex subunit 10 n=1 Tax=Galendromus occidentalis TaxID=34638 RepID=A0AAJ7P9H6_9ACAR|nr:trafficking protein particle complex subunit 10 [Galendromus occidentalis]
MEAKPLVTYAGKPGLFESLREAVCPAVSAEATEWKRSLGRTKNVHIDANWVPFDRDKLSANRETLLNRQYLHTFWTDCSDSDEYRSTVKQEIMVWMADLKGKSQWDWFIVVVEDNSRKTPAKTTSKLLKSTVWDKIRNDFPSKNIDRVSTFVRPSRSDKNASSLNSFIGQFRIALLHALNREIGYYEDKLREKREARNQPAWSFIDFYFMQEQLAFVLETMTLYEDALVQYDELDALLTQFVINAAHEQESPMWLQNLTDCKDSWRALCMKSVCPVGDRGPFENSRGSLLDLRNMLLVRICNILILLCRPWEMAQRVLPYIQNAQLELKSLGAELTRPGAVDAWALAAFLEILLVSERYNDSTQVECYSLHTAQLWAHARLKMKALGQLCGLMPQATPSSEQIHLVVNILAGLGDDPRSGEHEMSPCRRVSEALSSKESFMRHYKDICEIAMGTFKHVGRLRSARLIGKDLAEFYLEKDEPQMAVQFLQDLLKMYLMEQWVPLAVETQKQLLKCYELLSYDLLYLHTVLLLATNSWLDQMERRHFFDNVLTTKDRLAKSMKNKQNLTFAFAGIFSLDDLEVESNSSILTLNSNVTVKLTITSNLLAEVKMRKVAVPCAELGKDSGQGHRMMPRKPIVLGPGSRRPPPQITIQHVNQSNSVGLVCSNQHQVLSRQDSANLGSPSSQDIVRVKSDTLFLAKDIYLAPGQNIIKLPFKTSQWGNYELRQVVMEWDHLGFVEELENSLLRTKVDIIQEKCKLSFEMPNSELLAGVDQVVQLTLHAGSQAIAASSSVTLGSPSSALLFGEDSINILEEIPAFGTRTFSISLRSDFCDQWTPKGAIHELQASAAWDDVKASVRLRFKPPFVVTHKLHSCDTAKFLQVEVVGHSAEIFSIKNPRFECPPGLRARILAEVEPFKVSAGYSNSFVWQLESDGDVAVPLILSFSLDFEWLEHSQTGVYSASFKLDAFKTLYSIHATVEPESQGHCKVDAVCKLNIRIKRLSPDGDEGGQIHLEVLVDPSMWALLGKNSDVFSVEPRDYTSSIEMKPLVRGFLPVPQIRLMRYRPPSKADAYNELAEEKLEPFLPGQIYNWSRASQVHVPTAAHSDGK